MKKFLVRSIVHVLIFSLINFNHDGHADDDADKKYVEDNQGIRYGKIMQVGSVFKEE